MGIDCHDAGVSFKTNLEHALPIRRSSNIREPPVSPFVKRAALQDLVVDRVTMKDIIAFDRRGRPDVARVVTPALSTLDVREDDLLVHPASMPCKRDV